MLKSFSIHRFFLALTSLVFAILLVEGAHSLYFYNTPHSSLFYYHAGQYSQPPSPPELVNKIENQHGPRKFLRETQELEKYLPEFKKSKMVLGNTPYHELIDTDVTVRQLSDCSRLKPSLNYITTSLRSRVFNIYNPPLLAFSATESHLSPAVREFIANYGAIESRLTTDKEGRRITLPAVQNNKKILVVGDSVAMGVGISDEETLSSQLQKRDGTHQYINLGVNGNTAEQNLCGLENALNDFSYDRQIKIEKVIYIHCDNDFDFGKFRTPVEIVSRLAQWVEKNKIPSLTFVRSPFMEDLPPHYAADPIRIQKGIQLAEAAQKVGFKYLNAADIFEQELIKEKTLFAAPSYFVDHAHLSPKGIQILVQAISQL